MDNRNTREDINFSSNSDPINDVDTGWHLLDYEKNLKQREKRVNDWERSKRVEKERNERYERVLKQYDRIISSITESDILKKNLRKTIFDFSGLFGKADDLKIDKCFKDIQSALNHELKHKFFKYFERIYWKKETDPSSNLKIQRGGAKSLTGGIMEDVVLFAFYHFLSEIIPGSILKRLHRELGEIDDINSVPKRCTPIFFEWAINEAIVQTLYEKYEIITPLIKRDSGYFLGKAVQNVRGDLTKIEPWKIDPKYRGFNVNKRYILFERIRRDEIEPKRGRPSEGIELRNDFAAEVLIKGEQLFNRSLRLLTETKGEKKKEGLFGACVYVAAIYRWLWHFGVFYCARVDYLFIKNILKQDIPQTWLPVRTGPCRKSVLISIPYPVKSLKYWAEFFNISENTFRKRLNDLKEFDPLLEEKIKYIEIFRKVRDKYKRELDELDESLINDEINKLLGEYIKSEKFVNQKNKIESMAAFLSEFYN